MWWLNHVRRQRGTDPVAAVWCDQPTVGGIGVLGDFVLSVAPEHFGLVYRDSHGVHVDHAGMGDA